MGARVDRVCVSGGARVRERAWGVQGECVALPPAPAPAYTLILFDRVAPPAPPGAPEVKSPPPAKPRLGALCSEAAWAAAAPRPRTPRDRSRGARRSEVMN